MSILLIPPRRSKMSSELSSDACPGADHAARCACRPGRSTRHVACHALLGRYAGKQKYANPHAPRRVGYTCKSRRRSVAGSVVTEESRCRVRVFSALLPPLLSLSRHLPGPFRHPNAPIGRFLVRGDTKQLATLCWPTRLHGPEYLTPALRPRVSGRG
jgi:hypothetical protein